MQILQLLSRACMGFNRADGWAMASHIAQPIAREVESVRTALDRAHGDHDARSVL